MTSSNRLLLLVLVTLLVLLSVVFLVRRNHRGETTTEPPSYSIIEGNVPDSLFSHVLFMHYGDQVVTESIPGGYRSGKPQLFDTLRIVDGRFRFRVRMNGKFLHPRFLYLVDQKGKSHEVLFRNPENIEYRFFNVLVLERDHSIVVSVKDSMMGNFYIADLKGAQATLTYQRLSLDFQYQKQAKSFTKRTLSDLKLLRTCSYNRYLLQKVHSMRDQFDPDSLEAILGCFHPSVRYSTLGKQLEQYIHERRLSKP